MNIYDDIKPKVLQDLSNGKKPKQIAKEYRIYPVTIYRWTYRWRKSGELEPSSVQRKKRKLSKILDF